MRRGVGVKFQIAWGVLSDPDLGHGRIVLITRRAGPQVPSLGCAGSSLDRGGSGESRDYFSSRRAVLRYRVPPQLSCSRLVAQHGRATIKWCNDAHPSIAKEAQNPC